MLHAPTETFDLLAAFEWPMSSFDVCWTVFPVVVNTKYNVLVVTRKLLVTCIKKSYLQRSG